ncbi:hypothetical protein RMCBS344292_13824 [Rhizopus microsporus]|nr:hypothetical protein RMCBS344292_13824 [Rhizopus microsporus]
MSDSIRQLFGFILVAICWGSTNPLIKKGSAGLEKVSERYPQGGLQKWVAEIKYLLTKWQYLVPLVINLSGSIVYYYTLGKSGLLLGESIGGRDAWLGMGLVIVGVVICVGGK